MEQFKDRLFKLRTEHFLTQTELAEKLKLTKSAISMYENGERTPSLEMLIKISITFDVSIDWLAGFDVEKEQNKKKGETE